MNRQPTSNPLRILVVDDHGIVRDGLKLILEADKRLKVVAMAADGRQAVLAAIQHEPEVIVMDLVLPRLSGIDATERILAALPHTRVIILSSCETAEHIYRALRAGAQGYVLKESAGTELVCAVTAVARGGRYLSSQLTRVVIDKWLDDSTLASPLDSLSPREREVMHLTVAGSSSAAIAGELNLSRKTVDTYRSRIMLKLGVPDLVGLIHFAIAHALAPVHVVTPAD